MFDVGVFKLFCTSISMFPTTTWLLIAQIFARPRLKTSHLTVTFQRLRVSGVVAVASLSVCGEGAWRTLGRTVPSIYMCVHLHFVFVFFKVTIYSKYSTSTNLHDTVA